ncbi:MAG: F0F1 ATP synthase subunit A [Pseudomonadota bacterium]
MRLSPDATVLLTMPLGVVDLPITLTLVMTWSVMALLTIGAYAITRGLGLRNDHHGVPTRGQMALAVIVQLLEDQIAEISRRRPGRFLPFIGTLFLFIAVSNLLLVVPGFVPPTASLSTTAALAIAVLLAVPVFAIGERGLGAYLAGYLRPSPIMLPFNLIGEVTRTLALAIRLYGNVMSGTVIAAILIGLTPLFLPVVMDALGLITGMIQAYIFAVLAMVYIAAAVGPETTAPAMGPTTEDSNP